MLTMTWEFKLDPTAAQVSEIQHRLDVCRNACNFSRWERKDWLDYRQCIIDAGSIGQAFILWVDAPFPSHSPNTSAS